MNARNHVSIATLRWAALILALAACTSGSPVRAGTVLVSLPLEAGDGGNDHVLPTPSLSADGRYVAFTSYASNLTDDTPNPNDDEPDVYVRDLLSGTTVRVSDPADGGDYANARSVAPSISANGRIVAFTSHASDLIPGDPPGFSSDIYVRDLDAGTIERISLALDGVSAPNGTSSGPDLSADGRMVAFHSRASNLAAGDVQDNQDDVFVHDRETRITLKLTPGADSFSHTAAVSGDGRHVAFQSRATNLVPGDDNGHDDVFVHGLDDGVTRMISIAADGGGADNASDSPAMSATGRYIAFTSGAGNLVDDDANDFVDVFVRDMDAGTTLLVSRGHDGSPADEHSYNPCISDDGSVIAFHSDASNLVADDANGQGRDVFVHELASGITRMVHRAPGGGSGDGIAENCGLSGDGRQVAFESTSTNLVASDPNGDTNDIFRTEAGGDRIFDDGFDAG
jgi:Tol biopolymer transport system component